VIFAVEKAANIQERTSPQLQTGQNPSMIETMSNCIFCKIVAGESPSQMLYQDERITAFRDIQPVAPTHVLIVPNRHIARLQDMTPEDEPLVGRMFSVARQIAEAEGIAESGYRLIINNGPHGGQVVYHLHLHLIGGQRMRYPMG
jgi:histidine triad (HIT) family protein